MTKKDFKQYKDLSKLDLAKLSEEEVKVQKAYFLLSMKSELKELKETHKLKELRRYLARVKTAIKSL